VPSPFFRQRLRLAAFVDVGGLWERGRGDISAAKLRLTPGVGLRVTTPLGPARLDMAYNPSKLSPGILYVARQNGALDVVQPNYQLPRVRRFTFHFSVGQAF
jgi:outer membrane protein assembly factor BamA